ncbi:MAG: hypothetical protein VZR95_07275 [Alphaproteobacteria bacterium]
MLNKKAAVINEKGRSMIEMLGVLAIIGVLSVGGMAGYTKAMEQHRANKLTESLDIAMANIQGFTAGKRRGSEFWGHDVAVKANLIPEYLQTKFDFKKKFENSEIINDKAFVMQVMPSSINGRTCEDHFMFNLSGLTNEECIAVYKAYKDAAMMIDPITSSDVGLHIDNSLTARSGNRYPGSLAPIDKIVETCDCEAFPCALKLIF